MSEARTRGPAYAWYVVAVLMVLYVIAFLDRFIMSLLVGPLKADLHLTDTELSLLQGLAFALFYALLGIPLGRAADSLNRCNIIVACVAMWSLMTALCGFARSFPQLFLARLGVGFGEAGLSPAAYSIIADYFPRDRLSLPMSIYTLGGSVGIGLGLIAGGTLVGYVTGLGPVTLLGTPLHPWQLVFLTISTLGVLGVALALAIAEPARRVDLGAGAGAQGVSIRATLRFLGAHRRTVATLFVGFSCFVLMSGALLSWTPALLIRLHHWTPRQAGLAIGATVMIAGAAGLLSGGAICDRLLAAGRRDAPVTMGAVAAFMLALAGLPLFWATSPAAVLACFGVSHFFVVMAIGIAPAAVQMIAPATMRAQLSAIYLAAVSIIGQTLGPTAVALCTDYIFHDELKVNMSLAVTALAFGPACGVLLLWGRAAFRRSADEGAYQAAHGQASGPPHRASAR